MQPSKVLLGLFGGHGGHVLDLTQAALRVILLRPLLSIFSLVFSSWLAPGSVWQ